MIPEPHNMYLEHGLFNEVIFKPEEHSKIFDILFYKGTVDAHCPRCGKDSVLESIDNFPMVKYGTNNQIWSSPQPMKSNNHLRIDYYENQKFVLKEFKCSRFSNLHQFQLLKYLRWTKNN